MSADMFVDSTQLNGCLTAMANSIRAHRHYEPNDTISWNQNTGFKDAIDDISKHYLIEKDVNYFDYDGTLLTSYTAEDFLNREAHPVDPTHEGLTSQGWNWTLADAQAYVEMYGCLDIGQTYITNDGKTRLYITLDDALTMFSFRLSRQVGTYYNVHIYVNWGDESELEEVERTPGFGDSSNFVYIPSHLYSEAGDYVITITIEGAYTSNSVTYGYINIGYYSTSDEVVSGPLIMNNAHCYTALKKIEVGDYISCIAPGAFDNCINLENVVFPAYLKTYKAWAFRNCASLKCIVFPNIVGSECEFDNNGVFNHCINLERIVFPKNYTWPGNVRVSSIMEYTGMFGDCPNLRSVFEFNDDHPALHMMFWKHAVGESDDEKYFHDGIKKVILNADVMSDFDNVLRDCHNLSDVIITDNATSLASTHMFEGCENLVSITFSELTRIFGINAFKDCIRLKNVELSNIITYIPANAFEGCMSLTTIIIPSSVSSIDSESFKNCKSLSRITFPSSVSSIRAAAFSGCTSLKEIHVGANTPPSIQSDTFPAKTDIDGCIIYVPSAKVSTYKSATNWSAYSSMIQAEPT